VQGVFNGIKPAVETIVVFAAWRIGMRALKNGVLQAMAAFLALWRFKQDILRVVGACAVVGPVYTLALD